MGRRKSPEEYARERARLKAHRRLKVRDCARCGARVWGGLAEVSWVFMEMVNLTPQQEAWCVAQGIETWEVRLVLGEWFVEYRMKFHHQQEAMTGTRHIVFPSHKCGINWKPQEGASR